MGLNLIVQMLFAHLISITTTLSSPRQTFILVTQLKMRNLGFSCFFSPNPLMGQHTFTCPCTHKISEVFGNE